MFTAGDAEFEGISIELTGTDTLAGQDTHIVADASCCIGSANAKHEEDMSTPPAYCGAF